MLIQRRPSWDRARWARVGLVPLAFLALLEFGIVEAAVRGISLTGSYEESLGYRYFYTLRALYAEDRYVFTAQGQLMDLFHQLIQLLLTAIGRPVLELFPRIDWFSYASVMTTHLLAAAALTYAVSPLRSVAAAAALAAAVALPYFLPSLWGFYVVLQPDYQPWMIIVPLLTLGCVIRLWRAPVSPWQIHDTLALAGVVAVALGLKATLVVYPSILLLAQLAIRAHSWRSWIGAGAGVVLGVMGWFMILAILYHGHPNLVLSFLGDQRRFGASVHPDQPYGVWLRLVQRTAPWAVRASVLLPVGVAALFLRRRARERWLTLGGLLLGSVAYSYFLFIRYQPVTWFEAALFLDFCGLFLLFQPTHDRGATPSWLYPILIASCLIQLCAGAWYVQFSYLPYLAKATAIQRALAQQLGKYHDRIAFLVPDNSFRPLSVDSSILKGGSDVQVSSAFLQTGLVRSMFPRREYFFRRGENEPSPSFAGFDAVVFTVDADSEPGRTAQESEFFRQYRLDRKQLNLRATFSLRGRGIRQDILVWEFTGPRTRS